MAALEDLISRTGVELANLTAARERTEAGLQERRAQLDGAGDPDVAVVLMGSWGRREVTAASDDDFMLLVHGAERESTSPSLSEVQEVLSVEPGTAGYFGSTVGSESLVANIGLDEDNVKNLTRRLLLLLESVAVTNEDVRSRVIDELLARYLEHAKNNRPPRFLLNDVVRYWRTICVDFAGKQRRNGGLPLGVAFAATDGSDCRLSPSPK
jgi:hypothetical protein